MHAAHPHVLLLGCGHMGHAMLLGWRQQHLPLEITVLKPSPFSEELELHGVDHYAAGLDDLSDAEGFEVVVLAVPPQAADAALQGLTKHLRPESVVISLMAGKTLAYLGAALDGHDTIVRVMPNLPAALGQGICGWIASQALSVHQQLLLESLLAATGTSIALEHEEEIDIVTAISGSGPAYVFFLIKAMTDAGVALGLDLERARLLALHTVVGAGQYALQTGKPAEELLEKIAIRGGTTEAALKVLNNVDGFSKLLGAAITAAHDRAQTLAQKTSQANQEINPTRAISNTILSTKQ